MKDLKKCYTKEELLCQLSQMNIPQSRVVLMHSSLRMIGKVEGGAKTILDAMIEYFTADGGLPLLLGATTTCSVSSAISICLSANQRVSWLLV